jgi:hypothetical protein
VDAAIAHVHAVHDGIAYRRAAGETGTLVRITDKGTYRINMFTGRSFAEN